MVAPAAPTSSSRISQASTITALPPELLVIVRPPPSASNAMNLQVQLIVPQPVSRIVSRQSGEYSRSDSGTSTPGSFDAVAHASIGPSAGLQRSQSIRSDKSTRSSRSARSASIASSATGGNSTRRVVPLYNLEFHNLLTTTVTDAGTDAKVAKFLKRGVEVLDLGILDPTELSPPSSPELVPSRSISTAASSSPEPPSSFLSRFKRLSFKPSSANLAAPVFGKSESSSSLSTAASGLPIVPLFRTASNDPHPPSNGGPNHTRGYTWTVRKWLRKDLEGKAGARALEEVRFEWRRGSKRRPSRTNLPPNAPSLASPSTSPSSGGLLPIPSDSPPLEVPRSSSPYSRDGHSAEGEDRTLDPNNLVRRNGRPASTTGARTPETDRSRSPAMWESGDSMSDADSGCESDPEDSERPWTCEVVYGPKSNERRLLLGTLVPAPHHPRLVASLTVPFNLSPIALGEFDPARGSSNEGLNVEEMKDVLSVTCLWLVTRESLGGLGKRRKAEAGKWKMG
ncbi:hypothetical protein MNV49_004192 [Pseudohyphozyma bogoriensis]|nr:hypothetical protein MNV49_004192 [Pseudohyphozyma bogoriensis]